MTEEEQQIIQLIELEKKTEYTKHSKVVYNAKEICIKNLIKKSFGYSSKDFINHPIFEEFIKQSYNYDLEFWFFIENYLVNIEDDQLEKENFQTLTLTMKEKLKNNYLVHQSLTKPTFIRNVYLSENDKLIQFFMSILPIPKNELFYGYEPPGFIAKKELEQTESILRNILSEESIIKMQRRVRSKIRFQEEVKRITGVVSYGWHSEEKIDVASLLKDANTPYRPKGCDAKLADRIMQTATKIKLFSTIRHLTSATALPSIFNDGLFGRRTLEKFHMSYKSAALMSCDVKDGDLNVICFGPNEIDPHSIQKDSVEITLNFDKMNKENPCIFYKQRDFGYELDRNRTMRLPDSVLEFSHTSFLRCADKRKMNLQLFNARGWRFQVSELYKFSFMAYNVQQIHQILTLNFFRFIDEVKNKGFYGELANLSDDDLYHFLTDLGKKFTDTAEFNFYGAYKIEFPAIETIRFDHYTLDLWNFIKELKANNFAKLKEAQHKIPQLFESYRFIDYLLSKISPSTVYSELQNLRKECVTPFWLEAKEKKITSENLSIFHRQFIEKHKMRKAQRDKEIIQEQTKSLNQISENIQHIETALLMEKKQDIPKAPEASQLPPIQENKKVSYCMVM